ncbi:MAG TPA: hypothetical protein ENK94_03380 [Campylobacterales bacterium]|nr:hypothetical protein [Campylobacterales bacterium]
MIKDILAGVKEVVVELSSGMKESCGSLTTEINSCLDDLNVKMMGSYEEIEAHETEKALKTESKSEKLA